MNSFLFHLHLKTATLGVTDSPPPLMKQPLFGPSSPIGSIIVSSGTLLSYKIIFPTWLILLPWRKKQQFPQKYWYLTTKLHSLTSQKFIILTFTTMRTATLWLISVFKGLSYMKRKVESNNISTDYEDRWLINLTYLLV